MQRRISRQTRRAAVAGAASFAMLATGLVSSAAVAAPKSDNANSAAQCAGRSVPASKISLQMYSYNSWARDIGVEGVISELADIGYKNIEPFGGTFRGNSAEEFRALLKDYGLKAPSSHYSTNEATFDETLDFVKTVGQKYVGSGGFASPGIGSYEDVLATAETLNRLGERSVKNGTGKIFGHNHAREFTTTYMHNGEEMSAWEILVQETDPRYVTFQVDIAWAMHGGVDVTELLEEYGHRIELLHVKDATGIGGDLSFTDLGEGDIDYAPILDAAQGHVKYYVIERDGAPADREFAEDSFEYLTCLAF